MAFENFVTLITIDIEKAFYSLNDIFLTEVLKKFSFEEKFIEWIKILPDNQESCIVNGGKTSRCFRLERGAREEDPVSVNLFIFIFETVFLYTKENKSIKGFDLFQKTFLLQPK